MKRMAPRAALPKPKCLPRWAKPVIVDAFDADGLLKIVSDIRPDVIFHEPTDLPDGLDAADWENECDKMK